MRQVTIDLYRYSELLEEVQKRIARRWVNITLAYGEQGVDVTPEYAHTCLLTDPEEKYTFSGHEVTIS